ncbi:hypothetical protein [Desulfosporosinus fructosivorans]
MQPAVKCRGGEYLRIIYGLEYTLPENLKRLRHRSLGRKRSLALREFALGIEALERFVKLEPLYRVHECAFVVLALESEPVDPDTFKSLLTAKYGHKRGIWFKINGRNVNYWTKEDIYSNKAKMLDDKK